MSLLFHSPVLSDANAVRRAVCAVNAAENDASFANIFLLREKYGTELAFHGDTLLRRYSRGFRAGAYGFPLGGDLRKAVTLLRQDAAERGQIFRMTLLTHAQCEQLQAEYHDAFTVSQAENYTEYLYLRDNLAALRGSKYHGKRNHIAQFWRSHPDAYIQPLIAENVQFAVQIARKWLENRSDPDDPSLQFEFACIEEAAMNWEALRLSGLLLYAGGEPVGMTVVSEISDGNWDVHFEKVVPEQPHAWPVVANEMAKCLPQARYINREEDLGENGMRASKQSYRPDLLNEKYIAEWKGA